MVPVRDSYRSILKSTFNICVATIRNISKEKVLSVKQRPTV